MEGIRRNKRTMIGVVVSDAMDKTVVVRVSAKVKHPQYHKYVQRSRKYKAHDVANQCTVGDTVQIMECRPLSRDKCWRISRVVEKAIK